MANFRNSYCNYSYQRLMNLRTTIAGLVGATAWLVAKFGFEVSPDLSEAIVMLVVAIIGYFAKDKDTSKKCEKEIKWQ